MAKVKITTITGIRVKGEIITPGSTIEVDEKVAAGLIKLKAAKEADENIIDAEIIEPDADLMAAIAEIVSEEQKTALKAAGFDGVEAFKTAKKADLVKVDGVGDATADKILAVFKG